MAELRQRAKDPASGRQLAKAVEASKAPAISRAAAILRLLGRSEVPLGVHAIARELGLVPSTCLHVLRALVAEEFVCFDPVTKRYGLEAGVLTLARHWLRQNRFSNLVQPVLDRLGRTFGVTMLGVHIVGLEHIIVVAVSPSSADLQVSTPIGSRFPALISATGRCIAAFGGYSDAELEPRFKSLRWDQPPTFEDWQAQVQQTRAEGLAVDEGNYISGLTIVAAPVFSAHARLDYALVAVGLDRAMKSKGPAQLPKAILAAARTLTSQLGGDIATR